MKKGIRRSLVKPRKVAASQTDQEAAPNNSRSEAIPSSFKRATGGAGSAWKAGAVAQAQGDLEKARAKLAKDMLSGRHIVEIDPSMLIDPIGSDRRDNWAEQEGFQSFVKSIRDNGQDVPVLVWPEDPDWKPDEIDPANLERVQFLLLAGRRRREAARKLGRPVRAVIAPQDDRNGAEATFNMLVMRFRENEEREDLSAFERLLSIGQMYDELCEAAGTKVKAKDFADRIGVHESVVSRARAVLKTKDAFLNAFKNVYEMSFRELQEALATINNVQSTKAKPVKPKKLTLQREVGSRKLSLSSQGSRLSVNAAGHNLDEADLEKIGDLLAEYFKQKGDTGTTDS